MKAPERHQGHGKENGNLAAPELQVQDLSAQKDPGLRTSLMSLMADWDNTRSHHCSQKSGELHGGNTFFKFLYTSAKAAQGVSLLSLGIYEMLPALPGGLAEFKGTAAVA